MSHHKTFAFILGEVKMKNTDSIKREVKAALLSVKREGMENLMKFLEESDYFTAPASTKYHLAKRHGLLEHHFNVYEIMLRKNRKLGLFYDSIIICSLLHDVCKCGLYRGEEGSYTYDYVHIKKGHAKLSLEIIKKFIDLSEEEEAMIKFHMGTFGIFDYKGFENGEYSAREMHEAIKKFPSVQVFASTDMESTQGEE